MSLGVTTGPTNAIISDLAVSVTYKTVTRVLDPIYGTETLTYSDSTKSWIFFKHSSDLDLIKWGIVDIGDAYVIMPITEAALNYGDRVVYDGETFEFTPECKIVKRYLNNTALYRYASLRKVA